MPRSRDPVDRKRQNNTTPLRVPSLSSQSRRPPPLRVRCKGECKLCLHSLSPLAAWPPLVRPPLAPPPVRDVGKAGVAPFSPPSARGLRYSTLCANGECIAVRKGTPPPFPPLPPLRSKRTTSAGPVGAPSLVAPPFVNKRRPRSRPNRAQKRGRAAQSPAPCHSSKDRGALGGAARVGAGTQPAWQAPLLPFACGACHGVLPSPPFAQPVRVQCDHAEPECMRSGGHRGEAEAPPALRVSTTPRARHLRPTFRVPRSRRCAQGGMRMVGHAGVVHAGQHTGRAHIPSLRCANRRPRTGNVRRPCSLPPANGGAMGGGQRCRRNGARTRASCASSPSSAYPPLRATKGRVCK